MTDPFTLIDASWWSALEPVRQRLLQIWRQVEAERTRAEILPAPEHVLRAFQLPFEEVRVLLVGQDPYPTPGHPIGLAFATAPGVDPFPASLRNIAKELHTDVGVQLPNGDLQRWEAQGVMLLNRCLTVRAGAPGSHHHLGWQEITAAALTALGRRHSPLVSILWGKQAQQLRPLLGNHPVLEAPHPSPLSAHRGFFGSRPFSNTNELLAQHRLDPIVW